MQLVTTTNRRRDKMSKKLITTAWVVFALATPGVASAVGDANNETPASPGACNMVNASANGMAGMMNDRHVYDIMIPLVVKSEVVAGCAPVNDR
jgi:hypothetical protein